MPPVPSLSPAPSAVPPAPTVDAGLAPAASQLPRGTVVHVVDGDSLDVDLVGTVERLCA